MTRRVRPHRFKSRVHFPPGGRLKRAWRQSRGLFLLVSAGCAFALFLLLGLLFQKAADEPPGGIIQIETPSIMSAPPTAQAAATASPAVPPSPPQLTSSPAPKPTPTPTPEPPPDFDSLVGFYRRDAEEYYNEQGFSSNHYAYAGDELNMLAKLIYGEARGESLKGRIAVANVVMNRVLSRGFPGDTIKAVITASGQFTGYSSSIKPNVACLYAARQVLDWEVWVVPQNVYFFQSDKPAGQNWGSHKFYTEIGGHCFYTESYRGRNRNGKIPPALYERVYKWPQYGCEKGKRVYRLQYMLNKLDYKVKADSYFGKTTEDALIAFQKDHKMKADGVAGPASIKALIKAFGVKEYTGKFGG